MTTAMMPGSFDPVTNGHIDIMERGAGMFDKVIVAVLHNCRKKPLFTLEEKIHFLKEGTSHIENIEIASFDGLLIDFAIEKEASVLLKGLRSITDYDYEAPMAVMNKRIAADIETVFLHTNPEFASLSSSLVKEVAKFNALPAGLVPGLVEEALKDKFK
ncbi:pantetheine-phosphate adenylyltransferase [Alkalicoccus daliensis]|uniref:Phosphopantetheine adenylyltransferase n=1 Tax=Alkalicoccus daliensis TaxID=745820 RepID=A0A1G9ZTQ4_9BACI|nr:pantetheine-phosphate adenylyltransferase [Alkalicoccus daliensis]SDN24495.1 Phosphopantetheine adenylyltransferase [Alkalicoccus daliensis]